MSDLDHDQYLIDLWPRYDNDVSQIFFKKYTINDHDMRTLWPRFDHMDQVFFSHVV